MSLNASIRCVVCFEKLWFKALLSTIIKTWQLKAATTYIENSRKCDIWIFYLFCWKKFRYLKLWWSKLAVHLKRHALGSFLSRPVVLTGEEEKCVICMCFCHWQPMEPSVEGSHGKQQMSMCQSQPICFIWQPVLSATCWKTHFETYKHTCTHIFTPLVHLTHAFPSPGMMAGFTVPSWVSL